MRRLLGGSIVVLLVVTAVLVVNALRLTSRQPAPQNTPSAPALDINDSLAVDHLAQAIRFPTVTGDTEASFAPQAFADLQAFLNQSYPLIAKNLSVETVTRYALLYTWRGRQPDLPPVILTAHQDVVPADDHSGWTHPPFDGVVADGAVWGRGALDDKSSLIALFETIEALLDRGIAPERTIYLGFGDDEEGGAPDNGAAAIARALAARGVTNATVLDEGGWIYDQIPGVAQHVALIGIAEKGYLSLQLSVTGTGGHSSMPPAETAVGILARAVDAVERHQMPARLDGGSAALFDALAPEMSFGMKLLFANRWLTRPLILRELAKQPTTNASIRTTTAPTMLRAGDKENVLAASATAVVNFRLLPGDSPDDVLVHVQEAINDPRVSVMPYHQAGIEASPLSSATSDDFLRIGRAIRTVMPDVLVAPYLTVGATDGRQYQAIAANIYRFLPIDQPGGTALLHGPNEHIEIGAYLKMIRAYGAIIQSLAF